jgi:hypothetical protein
MIEDDQPQGEDLNVQAHLKGCFGGGVFIFM